jgi:hypothetical protein
VHANYVNGKTHELKVRGLWLLNDDQKYHSHEFVARNHSKWNHSLESVPEFLKCKSYNLSQTWYNSLNWFSEISSINDYQNKILESVKVNGTLIKSTSGEAVYMIEEAFGKIHKRIVPNSDTFEAFGFEWGDIKGVPQKVLNNIVEGPPLKKVNSTAS